MNLPRYQDSEILTNALVRWYYRRAKKAHAGQLIQEHDERKSFLVMRKFLAEDAERMKEKRERAKQHTGSTLGGCIREKWFKHFGVSTSLGGPQDIAKTYRVFEHGTLFHVRMQVAFERLGILRAREFRVDCDLGKRGFRGSIDAVIELDGSPYLVELKSAGNAFHQLGRYGPSESYLIQCGAYHYAYSQTPRDSRPTGTPKGTILFYESKSDHQVREYLVTPSPAFFADLKQHAEQFDTLLESGTLPPRPYSDATKYPCGYCDFVELCYNRLNLKKALAKIETPTPESKPLKKLPSSSPTAGTPNRLRLRTSRST